MLAVLHSLEADILLFVQDHLRFPLLTAFFIPFTTLGNHGELWIFLSLLLLLSPKTRKAGLLGLLSLLVCFLFNDFVLKLLFARPRPFASIELLEPIIRLPSDHSFPSGHSNASFAAACGQCRGLSQRWLKVLLLSLAVLMAFSRLYVGVHYPTDVLAGALEGIFGSWLVWRLLDGPYDQAQQHLKDRLSR